MPKKRILLVEDEAVVAEDLRAVLQELGYDVIGTESAGLEAIERATEERPDLVLMDVRLRGDPDGIEVAKVLHARLATPVVFLTAFSDEVTLERAKAAAPSGFLTKPVRERDLNTTIQIALHKHRLERNPAATGSLEYEIRRSGGGWYLLDRHLRFLELSESAERLFGASQESVREQSIWNLFPELKESVLDEAFIRVLNDGSEAETETYHLPQGIWLRLRIRPSGGGIRVDFSTR